jgi:hypothetical protein
MSAKTPSARPRFILWWAFGIGPALYVKRHGATYKYAGYVTRRGQTFVRWNREAAA